MTTKTIDVFTFNEKTHRYYLGIKPLTGVTTILGVIAKPALINWAANMAVDCVLNNAPTIDDGSGEYRVSPSLLEEARTAHTKKRDLSAEQGTDIHASIEQVIKSAIISNNGQITREIPHPAVQVQYFIDWATKNEVKFLASEKRVYSEKYFTAGTYDFKMEMGGKVYIGDIKTTSGIYDRTPFAQTAAYQMMELEHEPNNQIDGRLIINIKKDKKFNEDNDVYVSYYYEDDLALFMAALEIYHNMKNKFEPINRFIKIKK